MRAIVPHFIGIGARESSLPVFMRLLSAHPAVADVVPNLNFFGTDAVEKKGIHWYEERLLEKANARLVGEWSSEYLTNPRVPKQIAELVPEAKLFLIVRNPLERLVAEYESVKNSGARERYKSGGEFIASHRQLQAAGLYGRYLRSFAEYYSPVDLCVFVYDDLILNPYREIIKAYRFLDIDPFTPKAIKYYAPPPDDPVNPGLITRTILNSKKLYKRLRPPVAPKLFLPSPPPESVFTEEEINQLKRLYREDVALLSQLLSRDLTSLWRF